MSINLMSAIFQTEFRDLQDADGKTTKASTAKIVLLAMADHANDEGEGSYPSIESMSKKCALSEQTIRNTFDALLHNGIIFRVGTSKYMTHNHTINTKSFPSSKGKRDFPPIYIEVNSVEGLTSNEDGSNEYLKGVNPLDPNHPLTINETPSKGLKTDETPGYYSTAYRRGEQEKPDGLDGFLAMSQSPAVKRDIAIDDLLSKWAVAFVVKTTSKDWRNFAEYAVDQHDKQGWDPDKFIEWVKRQDGFPTYWSQKRMEENYPKAFIQDAPAQSTASMLRTL